jgi:hypothetical protein
MSCRHSAPDADFKKEIQNFLGRSTGRHGSTMNLRDPLLGRILEPGQETARQAPSEAPALFLPSKSSMYEPLQQIPAHCRLPLHRKLAHRSWLSP